MKSIKVGSDFSGVGAFDYAIKRIGQEKQFDVKTIYACDWDKFARQSYIANHGEPIYYPCDVYEREIPSEPLDVYMTSPPCQAFSIAGKRLGKDDKRGILFFNSHEFIKINQPRFFIFENVKGLLSDNNGSTFNEWINLLAGKSINGNPVLFKDENSVNYHVYWKVLNTKEHGVPQNRERVFIIGIRDDDDNNFSFPREEHLTKKLKDVLEDLVDDKYFLSEKMLCCLFNYKSEKFQINTPVINETNQARTLRTEMAKMGRQDNFIKILGNTNPSEKGMNGNVYNSEFISPTLSTNKGEGIKIKSATSIGYEIAMEADSINYAVPNSETRRGRVGHQVAQTLDTGCQQAIISYSRDNKGKVISRNIKHELNTIHTATGGGGNTDQFVIYNCYKIRRLTPRECFRLQDFPDDFKFVVSDSQLYKQAGNSITVRVLQKILNKLNL